MRRNKPRLIDPALDGQGHELKRFGVPSPGDLARLADRAQRGGLAQPRKAPVVSGGQRDGTALDALLAVLAEQGVIRDQTTPELAGIRALAYTLPEVKTNSAVSNSVVTFGTSLTTLLSTSVGPLVSGVDYLLLCITHARLSVDTTGFATAYARTQASSASVAGENTGTVNGERSCVAVSLETVTGAGSSVTMSARGQMTTSTGYASSTLVLGFAFPLDLSVG